MDTGNQKNQSIRRVLNIQIGIVILSVGVIIGVIFFLFSFSFNQEEFQNNIKLQTKHLSDTFTQQLWLFDLNATQQLSELAVDSPGIVGLRLLDHNKNPVVESGSFSYGSAIRIAKELRYEDNTLVGYIEIYFVNTSWKTHRNIIIIAGFSMILFTILASFLLISSLLNRHLVKPLNNLQKDMISLTSGKFEKSKMTGQKSEIQNIINVFNQMASALAEREKSKQEAEYQLTQEKIFIEALLHTLPGVFYVYEEGKYLIRWNKNFEIVSGFTAQEMMRKSPEDWVAENDKPLMTVLVHNTLTKGDAYVEVDLQFKNRSLPYYLTATKFTAGKIKYLLGVGIDLSKRKELEKALRQAHKMESIGTLAGGIAHDFNNILSPILGFAEMLYEDLPENTMQKRNAERICGAALRAKELVKQILTLSRQSDQELKPLRVQSILKEALKLLRSSIPRTIDIQTKINPQCYPVIADPTQIHQIIMNLSTNAYHAMNNSGGLLKIVLEQIEIECMPENILELKPGIYVMLKVIDNGSGIEKDVVDKIFDPYFTTKEMGKGTGLGLSLVQGIVKNYGGNITVYSEPGKGTEVNVYLPAIENKNHKILSAQNKTVLTGTEYILVVDDEKDIVQMEQIILERLGYKVTARNGSIEAFEAFKKDPEHFDLVLTDMTMPKMTGIQLAKKIRAIKPDIPVIICSGFSDQINAENIENFGIQAFMTKPVGRNEMSKTVRNVLDKVVKKKDKG